MNEITFGEYFFYGIMGLVAVYVLILLTRWVFRINELTKHARAQTRLLSEMARQAGVAEDRIKEITSEAE